MLPWWSIKTWWGFTRELYVGNISGGMTQKSKKELDSHLNYRLIWECSSYSDEYICKSCSCDVDIWQEIQELGIAGPRLLVTSMILNDQEVISSLTRSIWYW
jgi:hypothetical protein